MLDFLKLAGIQVWECGASGVEAWSLRGPALAEPVKSCRLQFRVLGLIKVYPKPGFSSIVHVGHTLLSTTSCSQHANSPQVHFPELLRPFDPLNPTKTNTASPAPGKDKRETLYRYGKEG